MAETFFDYLYPNPPVDSLISISYKTGKKFIPLGFIRASQTKEADALVQSQSSAGREVYFQVSLLNQRPAAGRGKAEHTGYVSAFIMDFDIFNAANPQAHANKEKIPQNDQELKGFLDRLVDETGLSPYSLHVHSGNGRHIYWLLNRYLSPSEAAPAHRQFQEAINHFAQEWHGWNFDPTSDLARVLRPVGTKNRKNGVIANVELLEAYPERRQPVEALNEWAGQYAPAFQPPHSASKDDSSESGKPDFGAIGRVGNDGCNIIADIVDRMETDPTGVTYYEWFYLASILRHCQDGAAIFHELSAYHPQYARAETDLKLAGQTGAVLCATLQASCNASRCLDCPLFGKGRSPIAFGYQSFLDAERADAFRRFVRVATPNLRYFDRDHFSREMELSPEALDSEIGYLFDGKAHAAFLASPQAHRVRLAQYLPGNQNRITKTDDGLPVLNLWTPSPLQPVQGDWPVFRRHLDLLFADPADGAVALEHLLDCIAHMVQHPGEKIRHGYLLASPEQQIGKGQLLELIKRVLGPDNHQTIQGEDFGEKFNAHTADYQLLIVEELPLSNKLGAYNKSKTLLTEREKLVEKKGVQKFRARTPDFLLLTSNHSRPLTLEKADKRFFFYESPMCRQSGDYYRSLTEAVKTEAPAILHDLLHRDLSNFDPKAPPPMTIAKHRLLYDSLPETEKSLQELVESHNPPFDRDVIHMDDLRFALGMSSTRNQRFDALRAIGAIQTGQIRAEPGNPKSPKHRLWIIRNFDRWRDATEAKIIVHWKRRDN